MYLINFVSVILPLLSQQCNGFQSPSQVSWLSKNAAGGTRSSVSFQPSKINSSRGENTQLFQASKRSGAMSRKKKDKGGSGGGFGKSTPQNEPPASSSVKQIPTGKIYSRPALYDLAFGYRNYEEEVNFLLDAHDKFSTNENVSKDESRKIIELAAGPARHSITSLRNYPDSVASCTAVDLSTDMMGYSQDVANEELGDAGYGGVRDWFHYLNADMRYLGNDNKNDDDNDDILKPGSFDSTWILLGSMQHLTTNDDVISCFKSVNNLLRPGGTMVIELPHPRETFTMVECTRNSWEVPLEDENGEYGELKIIWGDDDDTFDPIRQVRDFTVAMDLNVDNKDESFDESDLQSVREVVPMRLFTFQEIDALGRVCGFEVGSLYGALSDEIDVNNEDEAFRLVCVLRKTV